MAGTYVVENDIAAADSTLNLMELQAPSDQALEIVRVELGSWQTGTPVDELWRVRMGRYSTLGTVGDAVVPRPLNVGQLASGVLIRSNHATPGSITLTLFDFAFHIQAGFVYSPQEDERIIVAGSDIIGWLLENNDTAQNISFMVVFKEI